MKYTQKELVKAQVEYNREELKNPEYFKDIKLTADGAVRRIIHLLFLANPEQVERYWAFDLRKPGFYWFLIWTFFACVGISLTLIKLYKWFTYI